MIQIYNDRLSADLSRDAALKSITKIAANAGSRTRQLIQISNFATLIPRMFDLLHKAQRTIHLNTLEAMVAMISRYPAQFQQAGTALFKELTPFINDNDMQTSALALKVATPAISVAPTAAPEV